MIKKYPFNIFSFCLALFACFIPFNWLVGSYATFFSFSSMSLPALGYCTSLFYVILVFLTKGMLSKFSLSFFFLRRLPLIFATEVLRKRNFLFSVMLPVVSMILFCSHPIGMQVFYYSWYWFIPVICYFFVSDHLVTRSIEASFVAHSVGSVVWLYTKSIPAEAWDALMFIVPIERCFIALGMVSCVYAFEYIRQVCKTWKFV